MLRVFWQGPKVLARSRRERQQTKGLMSKTMVQHVRFESWYVSLPSSAKQQRKMTKFYVFWRTWTTMANFSYLLLELNAVGAYCRVLMKWNLWNRIDTGSTFATTLEWSRLFVAPIFNIFDATWVRRKPIFTLSVPLKSFQFSLLVLDSSVLLSLGWDLTAKL